MIIASSKSLNPNLNLRKSTYRVIDLASKISGALGITFLTKVSIIFSKLLAF